MAGLTFARIFTDDAVAVFDTVEWEVRDAIITGGDGKVVFEQKGVEVPKPWSQLATNIVASKYFRGQMNTPAREFSVKQLIRRVVETIHKWGLEGGYFATPRDASVFRDEVAYLMLHQMMLPNSPVLFNLGWQGRQQAVSACYLTAVEDTMDSILDLYKIEGMIFRDGSGAGSNLSKLRSSKEGLSAGGRSSGPVSFMKGLDASAGSVKSGGATRRAALLRCMNIDHPDIREFIHCKEDAEKKAHALIAAGFDPSFNVHNGAYDSIHFQNANISVRVTDDFMRAVENDEDWCLRAVTTGEVLETTKARALFREIAEAAHFSADPGLQFHDTINQWNSVKNSGTYNMTNPCQPAAAPLLTPAGIRPLEQIEIGDTIWSGKRWTKVIRKVYTGEKMVYRYQTTGGFFLGTDNHRVVENGVKVEVREALGIDLSKGESGEESSNFLNQAIVDGLVVGDGSVKNSNGGTCQYMLLYIGEKDRSYFEDQNIASYINPEIFDKVSHRVQTTILPHELPKTHERSIPDRFYYGDRKTVRSFLRGLYSANGSVVDNARITLKATSFSVIQQVQSMLSGLGIASYYTTNKTKNVVFANGSYSCKQSYDLNITIDRKAFLDQIGFIQPHKQQRLKAICSDIKSSSKPPKKTYEIIEREEIGIESVFDITVSDEDHTYWTGGVLVSNCGEVHMVDWTSCNLASLNLLKFLMDDGSFHVRAFQHAVELTTTMQEIAISGADFPTPKIAEVSRNFRPIGVGYANLGALLMANGLAYDSNEGRDYAEAVTAMLTGAAYRQSAIISRDCGGSFLEYEKNREHMLSVTSRHVKDALGITHPLFRQPLVDIWTDVQKLGKTFGFRNCEVSCAAPTGCVTTDTLILSDKGLIPVGKLGDTQGPQWQNLSLKVIQEQGSALADKFFVNGEKPVYRLTTERGHSLRATPNHRIRVLNQDGDYVWKRMDEVKPGDHVATRIGGYEELMANAPLFTLKPTAGYDRLPLFLDESLAEVVGFYMGNGYAKKTGGITFTLNDEDGEVDQHLSNICQSYGFNRSEEEGKGKCYNITFNGRDWYPWLDLNRLKKASGNHGEGAASAFIPLPILQSRPDILAAFLRGLFTADGTVTENTGGTPTVELSTVSETLATQIHVALEAMGIRANHQVREKDEDSFGERPLHRVRLTSIYDIILFAKKIQFLPGRKKNKLLQLLEGCVDKPWGDCIRIQSLVNDFYDAAKGLPHYIRGDIAARKRNGLFNTEWARRLIESHSQLQSSKIAKILALGSLRFVRAISCVPDGTALTVDISVPTNNTYTAYGIVAHNTIALGMDCDTTGVEPAIALVAYKKLVGGGNLKLVNGTVERGLVALGYSAATIQRILEYVAEFDSIEACPFLQAKDLPVFDCALPTGPMQRSISPSGHLKMTAAVQKFFSMGVSKTINCPNDYTVEDIEGMYMEAWKVGLKGISIYRDGCKASQPLNTKKEEAPCSEQQTATSPHIVAAPARRRLPNDRTASCHKFEIAGMEGYIHIGYYEDGTPGEIFVRMAKEGSTVSGLMDGIATMTSLALQYGVPLEVMVNKFSHTRFEPSGFTKNPKIPYAKSLTDYLFRFLADKCTPKEKVETVEVPVINMAPETSPPIAADAPTCNNCGGLMHRNGSCWLCRDCASTSGCS